MAVNDRKARQRMVQFRSRRSMIDIKAPSAPELRLVQATEVRMTPIADTAQTRRDEDITWYPRDHTFEEHQHQRAHLFLPHFHLRKISKSHSNRFSMPIMSTTSCNGNYRTNHGTILILKQKHWSSYLGSPLRKWRCRACYQEVSTIWGWWALWGNLWENRLKICLSRLNQWESAVRYCSCINTTGVLSRSLSDAAFTQFGGH